MNSRQILSKTAHRLLLMLLSGILGVGVAQADNRAEPAMLAPPGPYISSRQWIMLPQPFGYGPEHRAPMFYPLMPEHAGGAFPMAPAQPMQEPANVPLTGEGWRW